MPDYRPKIPSYRRKLLPFAIAISLSGPALAMGVGDIQLQSFLGAPLQAEIPLNHLDDVSADQLKVRIGSEADYTALGVDYSYAHSQFKIEPIIKNGRGYVRISTREPVSEPYLNFVLNVRWPQGQLVREFTVLLDPAPVAAVARAKSASTNSDRPAVEPVSPASTEPSADAINSTPVRTARSPLHREPITDGYVTRRGDSLWRVANRMRPANVPTEQMMGAILAANPAAFINGDAARLKEAATLSMPSAEQIAAAVTVPGSPTAQLASTVASASNPVANTQLTPPTIAAAELQQENATLKGQVEDLTGNVTALNDNLQQSEQRLHQLETQLSDLLLQFQQQRTTIAALSGAPTGAPIAPQTPSTGSMISQVNASELRPAPAALPSWWVHLMYWLGIGGVAMWAIREHFWPRRLATVDISNNAVNAPVERNAVSHTDWRAAADVQHRPANAPVTIEELVAGPVAEEEEDAPALLRTNDDPVDASISAGVFVAFGRFDEAERLLLQAIEQVPERTDLLLQLLDVYIQADRPDAFEALADDIERNATSPEVIAELAVLRENFANKH